MDAPAVKYQDQRFESLWPPHKTMLPSELLKDQFWYPNAEVVSLNPKPTFEMRITQMDHIVVDV